MNNEKRERATVRALVVTAVLACVTLLAAVIPSPYSIERPGPFVDTLGEATIEDETTPVIQIADLQTYPTTGELNLLTVSILGSPEHPLNWLSLIPALIDPSQRIAPSSEFYPEGVSEKDRETVSTMMMNSSQRQSAAAAFRELGEPVSIQLQVAGVSEDGPAEGILEKDDVLLAVGGQEVTGYDQLREAIVTTGAGNPLAVTLLRGGERMEATLTPRVLEGGDSPMLGAVISSIYDLPAEVEISLSEIGGPSAGMIFAIGIYDRLTPGPLLDGLTVSGTGTISEDGTVGAIGGLPQKMWAASRAESNLFLMPLENCAELPEQIPDGLTVAPVATLSEAIRAIQTTTTGGTPAGIERCEAP